MKWNKNEKQAAQATVESLIERVGFDREQLEGIWQSLQKALLLSDAPAYDARMIEKASIQHHRDGEIEIDCGNAIVSASDGGAYVQAWVYVENDKEPESDGAE